MSKLCCNEIRVVAKQCDGCNCRHRGGFDSERNYKKYRREENGKKKSEYIWIFSNTQMNKHCKNTDYFKEETNSSRISAQKNIIVLRSRFNWLLRGEYIFLIFKLELKLPQERGKMGLREERQVKDERNRNDEKRTPRTPALQSSHY